MDKKLVITIDGTEALRDECRYIKGNFYKIGDSSIEGSGQCYEVDGKFCRADTGYIVYDHGLEKYVKKVDSLIYGVINLKPDLETFIYGYFTYNQFFNVEVLCKKGKKTIALFADLFTNTYYREELKSGKFYHINIIDAKQLISKNISQEAKRRLPYDANGNMGAVIDIHKENFNTPNSLLIEKHGSKLDGLSFGLEFETTQGYIPPRISSRLGVLPLRDGSISGLEFVTIPLSGKKGLQTIVETCKELQKRTSHNDDCSLHIHFGGVPRTEEYLVALYKVLTIVQDEMFSAFPIYKKENHGVKKKCYTAPLPVFKVFSEMGRKAKNAKEVKKSFGYLFKYLSMGQDYEQFSNLGNVTSHPADPEGRSKWNVRSRYHWVNLIPIIFGNKKTVEFRIHTATDDPNKVINFMFICAAILKYTKRKQNVILADTSAFYGLSISKIINSEYASDLRLVDGLKNYFANRCRCTSHQLRDGNITGDELRIPTGRFNWAKSDNSNSDEIFNITKLQNRRELLDQILGQHPLAGRYGEIPINVGGPEPVNHEVNPLEPEEVNEVEPDEEVL